MYLIMLVHGLEKNTRHIPLLLERANSCKHLNTTRAPSENPMRVTGLEMIVIWGRKLAP